MDAQPSLRHAIGLVALVQGLALHSVESPRGSSLPSAVLAANDFRALRYGLETRIVDVDRRMRPMRDVAGDAISHARRALAGTAEEDALDAMNAYLGAEPEYQRQRRVHAELGIDGLLADLVDRTVGDVRGMAAAQRRAVV